MTESNYKLWVCGGNPLWLPQSVTAHDMANAMNQREWYQAVQRRIWEIYMNPATAFEKCYPYADPKVGPAWIPAFEEDQKT